MESYLLPRSLGTQTEFKLVMIDTPLDVRRCRHNAPGVGNQKMSHGAQFTILSKKGKRGQTVLIL